MYKYSYIYPPCHVNIPNRINIFKYGCDRLLTRLDSLVSSYFECCTKCDTNYKVKGNSQFSTKVLDHIIYTTN